MNGINPEFIDIQSRLRDVNEEIKRLTLENEIEYLKSFTGYEMELLAAQERLEVVAKDSNFFSNYAEDSYNKRTSN